MRMNPINSRSQSLPPSISESNNEDRGSRANGSGASRVRSGIKHIRGIAYFDDLSKCHSSPRGNSSTTQSEVCSEASSSLESNPVTLNTNRLDPKIPHAMEQAIAELEARYTGSAVLEGGDEEIIIVLQHIIDRLVRIAPSRGRTIRTSTGYLLNCKASEKRREQFARKAILDEAAKNRPLKGGKPLPKNRLLGAYGRKELSIDGKMATNHIRDDDSRCKACENVQMQCIFVTPDRFWNRSQCVGCVQRKSQCSLDTASKKRRRLPSEE